MQTSEPLRRHWRRNLNLTAALLAVWFVVTFVVGWFARDLSFNFFGWPFSFYVAAQGAPIVYLVIVGLYARAMNRTDRRFGVDEEDRS
jgi:putative solute:sodium symporter small subunit